LMRNSFSHTTMIFQHTFTPHRLLKCHFFLNFERNNRARKVLELAETSRSAKILFCP
jgi:hypothetical protein